MAPGINCLIRAWTWTRWMPTILRMDHSISGGELDFFKYLFVKLLWKHVLRAYGYVIACMHSLYLDTNNFFLGKNNCPVFKSLELTSFFGQLR